VPTLAAQLGLLGAPDGGRGQVLVQPFLKADLRGLEQFSRAPHLLIDRPERRAAIARDVTGRVQPRPPIARRLLQHQPHQRLRAVEQHRRLLKVEPVVQTDALLSHAVLLRRGPVTHSRALHHYGSKMLTFEPVFRNGTLSPRVHLA
jgi:hypothetical protein